MANLDVNDLQIISDNLVLTGTDEADTIDLSANINQPDTSIVTINAGAGNDEITGSAFKNIIYAESGDDLILSSTNDHFIDGGAGNDKYVIKSVFTFERAHLATIGEYSRIDNQVTFTNRFHKDKDTGPITIQNVEEIQFGYQAPFTMTLTIEELDRAFTTENLTLRGSAEADVIITGSGDDNIFGGDGNDSLLGSDGNDIIDGGAGNDTIYGGMGNDNLFGGEGDDQISILDIYPNNYTKINNNNNLYGGAGNDELIGEFGNDNLYGGAGNDLLIGSRGNDHFYGEDGDDYIWLNGSYSGHVIYGGLGNDIIRLRGNNHIVDGGDGNDTVYSFSSSTTIFGNAGSDHIYGHGNGSIDGGLGNDFFYMEGNGSTNINGGDGDDTLLLSFDHPIALWNPGPPPDVNTEINNISKQKNSSYLITTEDGSLTIENIEFIITGSGLLTTPEALISAKEIPQIAVNGQTVSVERYTGPVSFLEYQLVGNESNEVLTGSLSNDFFSLKEGDDAADGGIGDDVLDGGAGSNFLTGGDGTDTFFLDGRGGSTTWSTIADFNGDSVNIWGWVEGVSRLLSTEANAGADGFKGATLHYDLNNDGNIDTSITFTGLTSDEVPTASAGIVENNGYLLFQ